MPPASRSAAIDLDWLGWFGAPIDWDEHEDPRIGNANLAAMRANYLEVGVRSFVLAGTVRSEAQLSGIRAALGMPLAVVRLDVPLEVIRARLLRRPERLAGRRPRGRDAGDLAGGAADGDAGRLGRRWRPAGRDRRRRDARAPWLELGCEGSRGG